jgi:hypothetical protein
METRLADHHLEADLEKWILKEPRLLGENLLIIAKQWEISGVGRLDLLGIDSSGKLVIVELKRDVATREAIAQALDYASWLQRAPEELIKARAREYLKGGLEQDLEDAFQARFGVEIPKLNSSNHRIMIVASRPDDSAQRIVEYLAERHKIEINGVFFTFWKLSGGAQIIVRSVLVPETQEAGIAPVDQSVSELATCFSRMWMHRATHTGEWRFVQVLEGDVEGIGKSCLRCKSFRPAWECCAWGTYDVAAPRIDSRIDWFV